MRLVFGSEARRAVGGYSLCEIDSGVRHQEYASTTMVKINNRTPVTLKIVVRVCSVFSLKRNTGLELALRVFAGIKHSFFTHGCLRGMSTIHALTLELPSVVQALMLKAPRFGWFAGRFVFFVTDS